MSKSACEWPAWHLMRVSLRVIRGSSRPSRSWHRRCQLLLLLPSMVDLRKSHAYFEYGLINQRHNVICEAASYFCDDVKGIACDDALWACSGSGVVCFKFTTTPINFPSTSVPFILDINMRCVQKKKDVLPHRERERDRRHHHHIFRVKRIVKFTAVCIYKQETETEWGEKQATIRGVNELLVNIYL